MDLVLPAQIGSCPAAPGADLNLATSLLEMSVVGIPLLLALFQFINDHKYKEPEDQLSPRTFFYGIAMALSAFVLWGLYLVAYCVIVAELGPNVLTTLLYVLWWVMVIVISMIVWIQFEQMLQEQPRVSLVCYLVALGLVVGAVADVFPANGLVRVVAGVTAVVVLGVGVASQRSVRSASQDNQGAGAEDADEGMEGMDSVYK